MARARSTYVNKYAIFKYKNWIKYTILYTQNVTSIISQIYIEQSMRPTIVKIEIIIFVIMPVVSFKIYDWVFSGLAENSSYFLLRLGSNPADGRY